VTDIKRSCGKCFYCEKVYAPPPSIESQLICRRGPIPGSIPTPRPDGNISWVPMARITYDANWCYEFKEKMDS